MPTLRQRDESGSYRETWLDLRPGAGGREPPLTLGPGAGSGRYLHVPGAGVEAQLLGSAAARAFVLGGNGLTIGGRPLEGIRVLRHGDRIGMAGVEILYLDVSARTLQLKVPAASFRCHSPTCSTPGGDRGYISCPWCTRLYHTSCWLALERCAEWECYPIRRLLLAELAAEVKLGKMEDDRDAINRVCGARCSPAAAVIDPGAEILCCPRCASPYHPGCFLSLQGPCSKCGLDLRGLVARLVFRSDERAAR